MRLPGALILVLTLMVSAPLPLSAGAAPGLPVAPEPVPAGWHGHWAADSLSALLALGLLVQADVSDNPDAPVPRGPITGWVAQVAGLAPFRPLRPTFPDLAPAERAYAWVEALVQSGAIRGYPDGTFRPRQEITRAEVARILSHFQRRFPGRRQAVGFTDVAGHWAEEAIESIARRDVMTGDPDGAFRPDAPITFAEGVTVVFRLLTGSPDRTQDAARLAGALASLRERGGLVTVGEMAALIAQNYFAAPAEITPRAAIALLRRQGIPVAAPADAFLQPAELRAWVEVMRRRGLLDEIPALEAHPGMRPARFAADLQIVRDALSGAVPTTIAQVSQPAGPCFEAVGMRPAAVQQSVRAILRLQAATLHGSPGNRPPIAAFTVTSPVFVGEPVTYTDRSIDPDGDALTRLWAGRQESFSQPGYYTVTLTAIDAAGASATVSKEVEVRAAPNRPPIAHFAAPGYVMVGEPVAYTNRSTDPDGDAIAAARWTGRQDRFGTAGAYSVTLEVQDSHGLWSAPYSRTITVRERPANPPEITVTPNPVRRGQAVLLTIRCTRTVHQVWVDVPAALERVPVQFGDGETLWVENPDRWAEPAGANTWQVRLNIAWTGNRPADGAYPIRFLAHHVDTWSWVHMHDREECRKPEGAPKPVCKIVSDPHVHWETDRWTTEHAAELVVRGHVQLNQPGQTQR